MIFNNIFNSKFEPMEDREAHHKHVENTLMPIKLPSNIMMKSAYHFYQSSEANYFTESINELMSYIYQYDSSDWSNIEIEAKLGFFDFKGAYVRCYQSLNDIFKLPIIDRASQHYQHYKYDFNAGVKENQFYSLWYFVDKECFFKDSEIIKLEPVNYKETHYQSGIRRSIMYQNGMAIKEDYIHKKDKRHINIRNRGNDFRITACMEEKQQGIMSDDIPLNYREKFRASYKFKYFRLDLTIVSSFKDLDSTTPKSISYEVEFEFEELKTCFDSNKIEDVQKVFMRFIQNIFCFYYVMSPEYYSSRFLRPRFPGDSLYGDYIEKHVPFENRIDHTEKSKKAMAKPPITK